MHHSKSETRAVSKSARKAAARAGTRRAISIARHERKQSLQARIFSTECGAFRRICKAVNTPYALEMLGRLDAGDWLGIAKAQMPDPESSSFADDYLVYSVMRKNPRMPTGIDRREAAVAGFRTSEQLCKETNDLLSLCAHDYPTASQPFGKASLAIHPRTMGRIKGIIRDILGPLTKEDLEFVESRGRFGPGATFHCSSKNLTTAKKLESAIGLTPSLYSFVGCIEPRGWVQTTSGYRLTAGSKATTVSKDATKDRFIAIEPSLNMWWQLGVGALLRARLKRFGIDLKYQADKNRLRVRFAQSTRLATIDLSMASDTVARKLVQWLLPKEWYHLLALFRSPQMNVDGSWVTLEKMSSMGNGYTFELETLIFFAVAKAFDDDPYVFGDDIICRQDVAQDVIRTLNVFGFSVNGGKTYLAGSFFESCGSDYWRGRNVRPFFFKKDKYDDYTSAVIRMANAVRRYASRRNLGLGCDSRFLPTWLYLLGRCPDAKRTAVPEGYGDVGVVRNFDEATPIKLRNGHCGFSARVWSGRPVTSDVTNRPSGIHSSIMQERAPTWGPIERDWLGRPVAHQYGTSPYIRPKSYKLDDRFPYDPMGDSPEGIFGEIEAGTGGPTSSLTVQSVRGRNSKAKLRTMPVSGWRELGPWL